MSRTLELNKITKAQRARRLWVLLQEQQEKEKNEMELRQTNSKIS